MAYQEGHVTQLLGDTCRHGRSEREIGDGMVAVNPVSAAGVLGTGSFKTYVGMVLCTVTSFRGEACFPKLAR